MNAKFFEIKVSFIYGIIVDNISVLHITDLGEADRPRRRSEIAEKLQRAIASKFGEPVDIIVLDVCDNRATFLRSNFVAC